MSVRLSLVIVVATAAAVSVGTIIADIGFFTELKVLMPEWT